MHDGIITTTDQADTVSNLIKEALRQRSIRAVVAVKAKSAQVSTVIWAQPQALAPELAHTQPAPSDQAPSPSPDTTPTSPYKAVTPPAMTQCVNNPYISPPVIAVHDSVKRSYTPNKLLCHGELERAGSDFDDPTIDWTRMDF
jgi:hypothetical protein